jgi:hypothetical protein
MERSSISPIDFFIRILGVSFGLIVLANLAASGFILPGDSIHGSWQHAQPSCAKV